MRTPRKIFLVKFGDFKKFRLFTLRGHFRAKIDFSKKIFFQYRVGIFWRSFSSSSGQNTRKTYIYMCPEKSCFRRFPQKVAFYCISLVENPPSWEAIFTRFKAFLTRFFFTIRFFRPYFMIFKCFWVGFLSKNLSFVNP